MGKWVKVMARDRGSLVYLENGRLMTIASEMLVDGYSIAVSWIVAWGDSNGGLIDKEEREKILNNVVTYLHGRGDRVELD